MNDIELSEEKADEICAHLEETAEMMGVSLDKSQESVENLEGILLSLQAMSDGDALSGGAFMASVYLGEILKKYLNGEWVYASEQSQLAIKARDQLFFPLERIKKYLNSPDTEGLDFYVRAIVAKNN